MLRVLLLIVFTFILAFSPQSSYGMDTPVEGKGKNTSAVGKFSRLLATINTPLDPSLEDAALEKSKQLWKNTCISQNVYTFKVNGPHGEDIHQAIINKLIATKQIYRAQELEKVLEFRANYEVANDVKKLELIGGLYKTQNPAAPYSTDTILKIAVSPLVLVKEEGKALDELLVSTFKSNSTILDELMKPVTPTSETSLIEVVGQLCFQYGEKDVFKCNNPKMAMFEFNRFTTKEKLQATPYSFVYGLLTAADKVSTEHARLSESGENPEYIMTYDRFDRLLTALVEKAEEKKAAAEKAAREEAETAEMAQLVASMSASKLEKLKAMMLKDTGKKEEEKKS